MAKGANPSLMIRTVGVNVRETQGYVDTPLIHHITVLGVRVQLMQTSR